MPVSPKPRCRICHQLHCANPDHKWQPFKGRSGQNRQPRPGYNSSAEIRRRRKVVAQFLAENGQTNDDGLLIALCPQCGHWRVKFIADHITPIAEGGSEDGPLQVHCSVCSGRQGARLAARKKRRLI